MPIRLVDRVARLARLQSALDGVGVVAQGANTAPAARTGVISTQFQGLTAGMAGLFTPANNRVGTFASAFLGVTASLLGTFASIPLAAGGPKILGIDIVSGPMGGPGTTGDENGQGTYLRIYGTGLGSFSDYGVTAPNSRVTIGGQLVGNYRYLRLAPCGDVYSPGVWELCVQVGAIGALTNGVDYAVLVTTSAGSSNANFLFRPNPGRLYWLDAGAAGSNSNAGTQAAPFKDPQTVDGSGNINGGAVTSDKCVPGTTYVFRGGTTYQSTGKDGCCWRLFRMGGNAPTGVLGSGYCHFTVYPGPPGANAPDDGYVFRPNGAQSVMAGNDTARGGETAPYAGGKYGQYWSISGFRADEHPGAQDGVVTLGTAADFVRVVGNSMGPWLANVYSKAAGVAGNGGFVYIGFNHIHDLDSPSSETHGIYADGSNTGAGGATKFISHDWEVCYNKIRNIFGGSGLQCYGEGASGAVFMTNMNFHHNYVENVSKYGVNLSHNVKSATVWANLIRDTVAESLRIETTGTQVQVIFAQNTCYNPRSSYSGGGNCAFTNDYDLSVAGSYVEFLNNIVVLAASRTNNALGWFNPGTDSVGAMQARGNLYFDAKGVLATKYAGDTLGTYGDPKFVTPYTNFHLLASSPANNAGVASAHGFASSIDFDNAARPRIGSTKPSIGCYEVATVSPIATLKQFWRKNVSVGNPATLVSGPNPMTVTPGRTLIAYWSGADNSGIGVPTTNQGAFTLIAAASGNVSGSENIWSRFARFEVPAGVTSLTVTPPNVPSAGNGEILLWIVECANLPANPVVRAANFAGVIGAAQSWNISSANGTPQAGDLCFVGTTYENSVALALAQLTDPPAGFLSIGASQDATTNLPTEFAVQVVPATGVVSAAWSTADTHVTEHAASILVLGAS
jgi:hypothetical protein